MNEAKLPSYFKSYPEWEFYFGYKFVGQHNIGTKWGGLFKWTNPSLKFINFTTAIALFQQLVNVGRIRTRIANA